MNCMVNRLNSFDHPHISSFAMMTSSVCPTCTRTPLQAVFTGPSPRHALIPTCHRMPGKTLRNGRQMAGPLHAKREGSKEELGQLEAGETVVYEGSGPPAELVISILLGATLVYLPLTIASIGRRLWQRTTFTDRRILLINTSPLFSKRIEVPYSSINEVRAAPRAFGLWGDAVVFLKDGSRLELPGLEPPGLEYIKSKGPTKQV